MTIVAFIGGIMVGLLILFAPLSWKNAAVKYRSGIYAGSLALTLLAIGMFAVPSGTAQANSYLAQLEQDWETLPEFSRNYACWMAEEEGVEDAATVLSSYRTTDPDRWGNMPADQDMWVVQLHRSCNL